MSLLKSTFQTQANYIFVNKFYVEIIANNQKFPIYEFVDMIFTMKLKAKGGKTVWGHVSFHWNSFANVTGYSKVVEHIFCYKVVQGY